MENVLKWLAIDLFSPTQWEIQRYLLFFYKKEFPYWPQRDKK